ncbi:hypothetical protein BDV95DRAFT_508913 [Massariosphaeria phaeospora]|uniref:Zn(2)-C6 fungal-type domain-containing protein n=1 Tax=Massariosphaeria phaeospora TaxID=100035 RepID=A0A7C8I577_9PLEO|nr:hypothetical protein BDV95DRAFT_508913 [Massariosphaeria phaeospora]
MPKDRTPNPTGSTRTRRQTPVSCSFCRTRKLRCSRTQPCANCSARGIACLQEHPSPASQDSSEDPLRADILARLRRLEELIILGLSDDRHDTATACSPSSPENARSPAKHFSAVHDDVAWLERVSMGQNSHYLSPFETPMVFKIAPVGDIPKAPKYIFGFREQGEPFRCVWLPLHEEAQAMVQKYVASVGCMYHIVHLPSLLACINDVYMRIQSQQPPEIGTLVLLLSIITSVTWTWGASGIDDDGCSAIQADEEARFWAKTTEDVLEITKGSAAAALSLECVQAVVILSFVVGNLDGVALRYRSLLSTGILMSRELGLHSCDHPSNSNKETTIKTEMGRRAWWYLVGTDWLLASRYSGNSACVYQCSPRHMTVDKPLNVNDEDLSDSTAPVVRPIEQYTEMSYTIQRLRLAELSRALADHNPLEGVRSGAVSYANVLAADAELDKFMNDLPSFFKVNTYSNPEIPTDSTMSGAPGVAVQSYMLTSLAHVQRCRLHLPYLTSDVTNARFAHSRRACVNAARLILHAEKRMEQEHRSPFLSRLKYTGCLYSVFLASIVLLVDVGIKKSAGLLYVQGQSCTQDLEDAFRLLENAKGQSQAAGNLLASLTYILRKHEITPPGLANPSVNHQENEVAILDEALSVGLVETGVNTEDWMEPNGFRLDDFLHEWNLDNSFI